MEGAGTRQAQGVAQMKDLGTGNYSAFHVWPRAERTLLAPCLSSKMSAWTAAAHDLRTTPDYGPLGLAAARCRRRREACRGRRARQRQPWCKRARCESTSWRCPSSRRPLVRTLPSSLSRSPIFLCFLALISALSPVPVLCSSSLLATHPLSSTATVVHRDCCQCGSGAACRVNAVSALDVLLNDEAPILRGHQTRLVKTPPLSTCPQIPVYLPTHSRFAPVEGEQDHTTHGVRTRCPWPPSCRDKRASEV